MVSDVQERATMMLRFARTSNYSENLKL